MSDDGYTDPPDDSDDTDDQDPIEPEQWNRSLRWEHAETASGWKEDQLPIHVHDNEAGGDLNINITVNETQDSVLQNLVQYVSKFIQNRITRIGLGLTIANLLIATIQHGVL